MPVALFRSAVILLTWVAALSFGQSLKSGDPAPSLTIERTIPAGTPSSIESLRGKFVVLEFWATWCGYCIEEIPRLNSLARKYPEVEFISITDEQASTVEAFLAKRPIFGTVAIDQGGSTFKAYGVETRPRTILIDRNGILLHAMHPVQLTEAVMADFVADRPISPLPLRRSLHLLGDNSVEPLYAVIVRPARKRGAFNINPSYVQGEGIRLKTMLAYAYSIYESRMEGSSDLLETRYDFCVALPQGMSGEPLVLRDALERTFKLKARMESREVDALVLTAANPKLRELKSLGPTVKGLAGSIERLKKRYVVDETGLRGYYYIDMPSEEREIDQYVQDMGLVLSPARRTIEVLIVESLKLPTFR